MFGRKKHRIKGLVLLYFALSITLEILFLTIRSEKTLNFPIWGERLIISGIPFLFVLGTYVFYQRRHKGEENA